MVVPPLPVVSYLTSSISLLVTIHAAIDRVLLDIEQTKSYGQQLVSTRLQLRKVSESMQKWAQYWFMTEETPVALRKSLSTMCWGEKSLIVCQRFDDLDHAWSLLKQQLISILPMDSAGVNSWDQRLADARSTQQIAAATASERDVLQSNTSILKKAWLGNFKLEPFKRQLDFLDKRMADLETDSLKAFMEENAVTIEADVRQKRRSIEHEAYLLSMARGSEHLAKMLIRRCEALIEFSADVHIDQVLEGTPADRVKFLSQLARKSLSCYRLQVTTKARSENPDVGLLLTQNPNFNPKNTYYSLETGIERMEKVSEASLVSLYLKDKGNNAEGYVLDMCKLKHKSHKKESLATYITRGNPQSEVRAAKKMLERERIALSLFLVESAMLMITINELSAICACALQRVKMESVGSTFTLRLARTNVADAETESAKPNCSHTNAIADSPLQRLGFTLAEIALGKEVGRGEEEEEEALLELEQIPWARLLYLGAIQYCLSFPHEYSHDLQTFYTSVVEP
jgi:hypothetical protein